MNFWIERQTIKDGKAELQMYKLVPYKVEGNCILKYKVFFSVQGNSVRYNLDRIATLVDEEQGVYEFMFEKEKIQFSVITSKRG